MSYTQAQLDQLKDNYARGVAKVRIGDEEVTFRSLAEMQTLIASIEAALAPTPATRQHYPTFSRGT